MNDARKEGHQVDVSVTLDSPGGEVEPALEIGRLLRAENADVSVELPAVCASSCVFVLIGATTRFVRANGQVVIHRPYFEFSGLPATSEEVRKKVTRLKADLTQYLEEMNVSLRMLDEMMAIPSDSGRPLTLAALVSYGIGPVDPIRQEADDMQKAAKLNITHGELLARRAKAHLCPKSDVADALNPFFVDNPFAYQITSEGSCYDKIMAGEAWSPHKK
jgi:ATP-dependent protease ClpP protease subunit